MNKAQFYRLIDIYHHLDRLERRSNALAIVCFALLPVHPAFMIPLGVYAATMWVIEREKKRIKRRLRRYD